MQDSHKRIAYKRLKPIIVELNFEKISKTANKIDSETSKLQPVNLSETSSDTADVHQRAADSLRFFLLSQPDPSSVMTDWLMGCSIQDV